MKGVVILDGPDACGKTTLANRLIEKYGGEYIHATYKFAKKMPLYHGALLRRALKKAKKHLVIIDRLHVSEYIYAKVFRGGTPWPWMLPMFNNICRDLSIPIIICVPETFERGVEWFTETKKERYEMYDDMKNVLKEYIEYAKTHNVITYNRDKNEFERVDEIIRGYLHE